MSMHQDFELKRYVFDNSLLSELDHLPYAKELWPIVYILNDNKDAYIGETTDAISRFEYHLRSKEKNKLSQAHLIASKLFNKSATLDLESNLIKYIAGDGKYSLLNGNLGLANHNYFQRNEIYHPLFKSIWDQLRALGVTRHSLEHIDNSDLFKYSPYKTLGPEQILGLKLIIQSLLSKKHDYTIIEGGAGSGKTIIAIFLFKLLNTPIEDFNFGEFGDDELEVFELVQKLKEAYPEPKMALVIPMSSFRKTIQNVFRHIKGLRASMVIGPSGVVGESYDLVVVDEAHRLRRRVNLGASFGAFDKTCKRLGLDKAVSSELDWILKSCKKSVFFYDEGQSIKPTDTPQANFGRLKASLTTKVSNLRSQFRVLGGMDYVKFLDDLFKCRLSNGSKKFKSKRYDFLLFTNLKEMVDAIKSRENELKLSRVVAGYAWPWVSKEGKKPYDIVIDGLQLKWNSTPIDWINSSCAINEVGCIHTVQGYDLNYAGVIFGNEISYDKITNQIVIRKENYHDRNGKQTIKDPSELKAYIINIYRTMMLRGIRGTYVYACDKDLQDYFSQHLVVHSSFDNNENIQTDEIKPWENSVPLYDLRVAAGNFSPPQEVNESEWIKVPTHIHPSRDLFACRIVGNSMNKVIPDGSIALFRHYSGGSRNGKIVLVMLNHLQDPDSGSHFTIKEYRSKKSQDSENDSWQHKRISLHPLSNDVSYTTIEISEDASKELQVVGIFECVLK